MAGGVTPSGLILTPSPATTLKNSRPLLDFEEYAVSTSADTPYMIPWSTIKGNAFSANTSYPKPQYSVLVNTPYPKTQYSVLVNTPYPKNQYSVLDNTPKMNIRLPSKKRFSLFTSLVARLEVTRPDVNSPSSSSLISSFLSASNTEVEGGIFYQELGHWACNLREIFYESFVESGMSQRASDGLHVCGIWHWSKELPKTENSSMNTSMLSSISSWNMAVIQRWKVADTLHNPNGIYLYAKVPYGQTFEHLVDKWEWKVIFSSYVIKLTIVDAHAPSGDRPLWNELALLILHYGHSSFLWDNLDRTDPRTVRDGDLRSLAFSMVDNAEEMTIGS
ncbi:hypothetical protein Tco_0862769 [Tanacetum coccineum]